jgi:hypothetical protein
MLPILQGLKSRNLFNLIWLKIAISQVVTTGAFQDFVALFYTYLGTTSHCPWGHARFKYPQVERKMVY